MGIISKGNVETRRTSCDKCMTSLKYNRSDIRYKLNDDYLVVELETFQTGESPNEPRKIYFIRCPVCKHKIFVDNIE